MVHCTTKRQRQLSTPQTFTSYAPWAPLGCNRKPVYTWDGDGKSWIAKQLDFHLVKNQRNSSSFASVAPGAVRLPVASESETQRSSASSESQNRIPCLQLGLDSSYLSIWRSLWFFQAQACEAQSGTGDAATLCSRGLDPPVPLPAARQQKFRKSKQSTSVLGCSMIFKHAKAPIYLHMTPSNPPKGLNTGLMWT